MSLFLASCNSENSSSSANTSSGSEELSDKAPQNPIQNQQTGKPSVSPKDATAPSNYNESEIDSLYSSQKIDINGLDRYVNSLSAFDYVRGHEAFKTFKKLFTEHEVFKNYLTSKTSILVLAPTDEYLENSGRREAVSTAINSNSGDLKPIFQRHVYNIIGKYIGGDFITIEDFVTKSVYRINRREDGAWYFKRTRLVGEPALVNNGIVFGMEGDFFSGK